MNDARFTNLLLLPGKTLLIALVALPLLILVVMSFGIRTPDALVDLMHPTFENYTKLVDSLYLKYLLNSVLMSAVSAVGCFVIGFPLAYFIAQRRSEVRNALLFLVMLPFFTSFLARTYAWFFLLRPSGIIGSISFFGTEVEYLNSMKGAVIGLIYGYLPLMVLPLFVSIQKIGKDVIEAARDLGASEFQAVVKVVLPLSIPGIRAGFLLVFVPCLGEFLIPKMLGGGKLAVVGTLIEDQFFGKIQSNWPFGAAITTVIVVVVLVSTWIEKRGART